LTLDDELWRAIDAARWHEETWQAFIALAVIRELATRGRPVINLLGEQRCERCGTPMFAARPSRKRFCSTECRWMGYRKHREHREAAE
jgi:hypothetical protein